MKIASCFLSNNIQIYKFVLVSCVISLFLITYSGEYRLLEANGQISD